MADVSLGTVILRGTFASLPAAAIAGRTYYTTDTGKILRDNGTTWDDVTPPPTPLVATTGALGGSAMTQGQTVSTTVAVTGASLSMVAVTSPNLTPGPGFFWYAYVSSPNVVTVLLTCAIAGTPIAATYNVRVIQ